MEHYKVDLNVNKQSQDHSILGKVHDYHELVVKHEALELNLLLKSPIVSSSAKEVVVRERHTGEKMKSLMFGSNNYLGVITNPSVITKTIDAIKEYGVGSGGVPILSGTSYYHDKLEKTLSVLSGFEDTMLFSSGFTANLGVILGLIRPQNLIIQDRLNHASLLDGALMSGAKMMRYKHNDPSSLEKILEENFEQYKGGILVVTDGVFSMDGDIANIPALLEICERYGAILLIDEAHSTGVIGEKGRGTLSYHNIIKRDNIIITGTLSKALGTIGGYISASKKIIDYLRIYARSNLYSTSLPPSVCASAIEAINFMLTTNVVESLQSNAEYMRIRLQENGYNIMNTKTAVIPIIIGDEYKLTMMSKDLLENGIFISCIFPPAVPPKTARLRVNMNALLTKEDIDYFVDVLNKIFDKYELKRYIPTK